VSDLFPLKLTQAVVRRRGHVLLGPVDMTIGRDGLTLVIGPNGAGKSTLLRALHGLDRLASGTRVWPEGADNMAQRQAFVFQTPVMLRRSVGDQLIYPLRLRGVPRAQARDQARHWAGQMRLADAFDRPARDLSGGERQKLALARALITGPELLFLDEPCASLDGRATREIEETLLRARKNGTRIVMATHDMGQARRLAETIVFLHQGRVRENAPAPAFFTDPQTPAARAFLKGDIVE